MDLAEVLTYKQLRGLSAGGRGLVWFLDSSPGFLPWSLVAGILLPLAGLQPNLSFAALYPSGRRGALQEYQEPRWSSLFTRLTYTFILNIRLGQV